MDEDKIAERAGQIIALGIDSEMAWKLAKDEAKPEEIKQSIAQAWNKIKGSAEIGLAGLVQILTLLSSPVPLAAGATGFGFLSYLWGREKQNKLLEELKKQIDERINETQAKLDEPAISFDEFMELFIQAMDTASKSKSELKQQALAKALVNSVIPPTRQFIGKLALLRILSQLSDEEMIALQVVYDEKPHIEQIFLVPTKIEARLGCSSQDALVICQSLRQLGLVSEPNFNTNAVSIEYSPELQGWRITELAQKLIKWVTEEVPQATTAEANTSESVDSPEYTVWSQLTAEQFVSGYSEADAIYDTI
jgi:hypothetical protein